MVALCAREGVAVVPQGGNTGLVGGSVPDGDAARDRARARTHEPHPQPRPRSTTRRPWRPAACSPRCRPRRRTPGACSRSRSPPKAAARSAATSRPTPAASTCCATATRASRCSASKWCCPTAGVWNGLRGLRKDNTGYDLKQLFLGAEGTLGVITAAVLRLYPKPTASATAWIALASPAEAVELLAALRGRVGDRISAFELVSRTCLEAVLAHVPDARDPLAAAAPLVRPGRVRRQRRRRGPARAGRGSARRSRSRARAKRRAGARALASAREHSGGAVQQRQARHLGPDLDASPSSSSLPMRALRRALSRGRRSSASATWATATCTTTSARRALVAQRDAVNRVVYDAVARLGGSISAEHGLGQLKREAIRSQKPPLELELMRVLKTALDPKGLMNPGKVL